MDDRRNHPRYSAVEVRAEWVGSEESPIQIRDVSAEGICLVGPKSSSPGSRIRLRLSLDFGENRFSEAAEVSYRVVWCTAIKDVFQIGAAAVELDATSRNHLATIIHYLTRDVSLDGELRFRTRQ